MENYLTLTIPDGHTAAKFSNPFYNCKLKVHLYINKPLFVPYNNVLPNH